MEILVLLISVLLLTSVVYLICINKQLRAERDLYKQFYQADVTDSSQELLREEYRKILETAGITLAKRHRVDSEVN